MIGRRAFAVAAGLALAACEPAGTGNIVEVEASGTIVGLVFVDANASGTLDGADQPAALLTVALVLAGSADTVADTRTDAEGAFSFPFVAAGTYDVVVPASALGDTMAVVFRDPPGLPVGQIGPEDTTSVTVGDGDSASVTLGVAYPIVDVETARTLPVGRRVFVAGVTVAGVGTAADSTLFIEGTTRGIAVRRSPAITATAGDSVLVFGTTATRDGQRVLNEGSAAVRASDVAFDTIRLNAAQARTAGGGVHDARLVRVDQLVATDTARVSGRFIITAEDPSGTVEVSVPIARIQPEYVPGYEFDAIGVLLPRPGVVGVWQLRPRADEDLLEHGS